MVYTLRTSRKYGFLRVLESSFIGVLPLLFFSDLLAGALGAVIVYTVAGVTLFFVIIGVLGIVFPPRVLRADTSGVILHSAILRRAVVFLAWHEIASIEVRAGDFKFGDDDERTTIPILVIRTATPGRRARGCVNSSIRLSRLRIQEERPDVNLADPRNIMWVLFSEIPPDTIAEGINAVRARAERNKRMRASAPLNSVVGRQ